MRRLTTFLLVLLTLPAIAAGGRVCPVDGSRGPVGAMPAATSPAEPESSCCPGSGCTMPTPADVPERPVDCITGCLPLSTFAPKALEPFDAAPAVCVEPVAEALLAEACPGPKSAVRPSGPDLTLLAQSCRFNC